MHDTRRSCPCRDTRHSMLTILRKYRGMWPDACCSLWRSDSVSASSSAMILMVMFLRGAWDRANQITRAEQGRDSVSYTHLRAHETGRNLVCRLLLEQKKN